MRTKLGLLVNTEYSHLQFLHMPYTYYLIFSPTKCKFITHLLTLQQYGVAYEATFDVNV